MDKDKSIVGFKRHPLIQKEDQRDGGYVTSVAINHADLDVLVGRLMQMCDLVGDPEQRVALKSTIKQITRKWLDEYYHECGYTDFTGADEIADAHRIVADLYAVEQ